MERQCLRVGPLHRGLSIFQLGLPVNVVLLAFCMGRKVHTLRVHDTVQEKRTLSLILLMLSLSL
jgi:hypothetical protein